MRSTIAATLTCTAAALLAGCGGEGGTTPEPPTGPPGITIVSGSGVADSVQAILPPLVIELRDEAGHLLPNTDVQFEAEVIPVSNAPFRIPRLYIRTDKPFSDYAQALTDANGRATLQVAMGSVLGPASITISALPRRVDVKATYEVRPGAPATIEFAPQDTALRPGLSFTPRVTLRDRLRNVVPGTLTLTRGNAAVAVTGTLVQAQTVGRTFVTLQVAHARDSIGVSVVPPGTLAAVGPQGLVLMQTDGSGRSVVSASGRAPRWMPDGQTLVFWDNATGRMVRANTATHATATLLPGSYGFSPYPAQAGDWIYFVRPLQSGTALWRVRPDGTDAAVVPGFVEQDHVHLADPAPSPDGTRLAYVQFPGNLRVAAIGTGAVLSETPGNSPVWSPNGEWIAYRAGLPLRVMRPDGTGGRVIGAGDYLWGLDWSSTGEWVIARSIPRNVLELIHVQNGTIIPLPFSADLESPAWKP